MKVEFTKDELEEMIRIHIEEIIPTLVVNRKISSIEFQKYSTNSALTIELETVEPDEAEKAA